MDNASTDIPIEIRGRVGKNPRSQSETTFGSVEMREFEGVRVREA